MNRKPHHLLSCPAKAGHPVFAGSGVKLRASAITGSSACADDDKKEANDDKSTKKKKPMRRRPNTNRSFPGRMTLDEWLVLPYRHQLDLARRAQCELLNCHRLCASKQCKRHRTCCGDDAMACERRLWQLPKTRPKTLRRESARLEKLAMLYGLEDGAPWFGAPQLGDARKAPSDLSVSAQASSGRTSRRSSRRSASRPVRAEKKNSDAGLWEIIQTGQRGDEG
jgi:alkylhydroperoxidase family enzyme